MKRSWLTNLIIAGVIGLLTLFLGLQYNWLLQASEAERERTQKRAEMDTKGFADDFNREIQAAYFNFQTNADTWKKADYAEFNERYDYWKSKTAYPELIREIVFIPAETSSAMLRYDPLKRTFETAEPSKEIDSIRTQIAADKGAQTFFESDHALSMPIHENEQHIKRILIDRQREAEPPTIIEPPKPFGHLIVILDRSVINDRILPELAAKHFPDGSFKLAVLNRESVPVYQTAAVSNSADASFPLFDLTPDNFIFFSNSEMMRHQVRGEAKPGMVINQRMESRTFTKTLDGKPPKGETFQIEMKESGGKPRTAIVTGTSIGSSPWTLNVQHSAGSIDAFIRGERNRSFLIGLGIYLLLVGSILAIVVSAMRSKKFAQRQIDFVSSVSHEFRTPLAVIYSAGENLADGVAKDETQVSRYGDLIKGEGKKLSGMVEQILEFAGASSGRKKYNFAAADVGEITETALAECSAQLQEKGFEVETNIADELPPVKADTDALSSAIQNLIQNSIKYSNGSRWLRVSAENGNGTIKVSVEDHGIGIERSDLKQIFEPFYRTKNVVDAQIHGNGLGLSLVKEIAEAHGGKVNVTSEPGKGSKFTIELPQKEI